MKINIPDVFGSVFIQVDPQWSIDWSNKYMLYEKFKVAALSRVKRIKLLFWYHESVHNYAIARVIFSQNSIAFAGELEFIHNSRCP